MNKWKNIRRSNLGEIPQEASANLKAPEIAPSRKENQETNKRIKPLGFKVSEEFFWELKQLALREKCLMVEIIEKAVENYKKKIKHD
jgi:hypothetical protein